MIPNVLSIAGSDPGGGAGIQADLKTFAAHRCHGLSVITALTAQNTQGVLDLSVVPTDFVAAQLDALFADIEIHAVKIGMMASPEIVEMLGERLARYQPPAVILDPVLVASSGASLTIGEIAEGMIKHLAPRVTLITPNVVEAAYLTKSPVPEKLVHMPKIAMRMHELGFAAVLVKGGDRAAATCDDVFYDGSSCRVLTIPRVFTENTHGTGCTLAAAIAANVAQGLDLIQSVESAKDYVRHALEAADELNVGHGPGPLNHFYRFW